MHRTEWTARWRAAWHALGATATDAECDALLARYDEPSRHYHTRRHLEECLVRWDRVRARAEHPADVELALWYHDAIYDTHRSDNEAKSAELAVAAVARSGAGAEVARRVHDLILATRHAAPPVGRDAALLVDVDLGILAAPVDRFDEYEREVREEYAWVPGLVFRVKRRGVLEAFLARERIFVSGEFDADEGVARANLARSLGRL